MKKTIATLSLIMLIVPLFALAQTNPCAVTQVTNPGQATTTAPTSLPLCINQVYIWSLGVAALLALLMIIIGGYYVMTASGNAEQASKGKEFITSALIGVALLFAAYLILNLVNPDLVNFNVNSINCLNGPTATGCPAQTVPQPHN